MKTRELFFESKLTDTLARDSSLVKKLMIAIDHDETLPPLLIAKLGPRPTPEKYIAFFDSILSRSLSETLAGDLYTTHKLDEYIFRHYISGSIDYEYLTGELIDSLVSHRLLLVRNLLRPEHTDLNSLPPKVLPRLINKVYRDALEKIKNQATVELHKKTLRDVKLIDNERFFVSIPLNYGACYTHNNAVGITGTFCTGSSSGLTWFQRYAVDGPIITVIDKANLNEPDGKWQIHAPTQQILNATQDNRWNQTGNDKKFATLFPGLMKAITQAMAVKADEIARQSQEVVGVTYNVADQIHQLKIQFPISDAS